MEDKEKDRSFFLVTTNPNNIPLSRHLEHGYEDKWDFLHSVEALARRWKGRVGERIDERHEFYLLRFHDTPGGKPDEAWIPRYILKPAEKPDYLEEEEETELSEKIRELDAAFGFDD